MYYYHIQWRRMTMLAMTSTNESPWLVGGLLSPSNDNANTYHHQWVFTTCWWVFSPFQWHWPLPPPSLHDSLVDSFPLPTTTPAPNTTNESSQLVGGFSCLSKDDISTDHHCWVPFPFQRQCRHRPPSLVGFLTFPTMMLASMTTKSSWLGGSFSNDDATTSPQYGSFYFFIFSQCNNSTRGLRMGPKQHATCCLAPDMLPCLFYIYIQLSFHSF